MSTLVPADFFVLRTPTLPWEVIETWSAGLEAAQRLADDDCIGDALERDTSALRARLRDIVRRPEVRAAIAVASPSLEARLSPWLEGNETEAALGVEPAVVRYVMRMAGRATPFGLFAGCSSGRIASRTDLLVPERTSHERRTRIDLDWVFALADRLSKDVTLRPHLRYRTNGTLYETGGRIRYNAVSVTKTRRSFHLRDVVRTPPLDVALDEARAATGRTMKDIAQAIVEAQGDVDLDEALTYVESLVNAQLLWTPLYPAVTGDEPVKKLIGELRQTPLAGVADTLQSVIDDIAVIDAAGWSGGGERYAQAKEKLQALLPDADAKTLFRTDLRKPVDGLTLGKNVVREIAAGVELLARMAAPSVTAVDEFIREFQERDQDREVPLLEALDAESGIGFDSATKPGTDTPLLLEGLKLGSPPHRRVPWSAREQLLLRRLTLALRENATEIVLTESDINVLSQPGGDPLAPSLNVLVSIAAASYDALERGKYRLFLDAVSGNTSGALLGRFLHADPELEAGVRAGLRNEEEHDGDALHAEVAHLPPAPTSNLLSRPILRDYEIEVAAGSGAPADRQIPLADLLISIRDGKVQLRSRKHGKRVVPHLSNAHAYHLAGLPAYRLLASLQEQGHTCRLGWSWGAALEDSPFLPRVSYGKLVLSLACWKVPSARLTAIAGLRGADRFTAVQRLRAELGLPRYIRLVDSDNTLPVDLENVLSIESLLSVSRQRPVVTLSEMFPAVDELLAHGPEGAFFHEAIVPLFRAAPAAAAAAPRLSAVKPLVPTPPRAKRPGEEWLYAKVYGGTATLDRILVDVVAPLVRDLRLEGAIDRWFFIRYADPGWHLRLRLHGEPERIWCRAAPRLFAAIREAGCLVHRVALDTYDPEVERYGGDEAIGIAEQLFEADSDAALGIVKSFRSDQDTRWRLALAGMDALLEDLGFSLEEKREIATYARAGQAGRFASGTELTRQLGEKYRTHKGEIEKLLLQQPERYPAGAAAIKRRGVILAGLAPRLRDLEQRGKLVAPRIEIASSYLHMWANRVLRGSANAQEFVLYDFLCRAYGSALARAAKGPSASAAKTGGPSARVAPSKNGVG